MGFVFLSCFLQKRWHVWSCAADNARLRPHRHTNEQGAATLTQSIKTKQAIPEFVHERTHFGTIPPFSVGPRAPDSWSSFLQGFVWPTLWWKPSWRLVLDLDYDQTMTVISKTHCFSVSCRSLRNHWLLVAALKIHRILLCVSKNKHQSFLSTCNLTSGVN